MIERLLRHPAAAAAMALAIAALPISAVAADSGETAYATFAGGCFWCIEADFEKIEGVLTVTSGYTGGHVANPTYKQVSAGGTGHTEAIRVVYDPDVVTYEELLDVFWHNIDPTVVDRQFCDVGDQYRSGIFYHDQAQREAAERSRARARGQQAFSRADRHRDHCGHSLLPRRGLPPGLRRRRTRSATPITARAADATAVSNNFGERRNEELNVTRRDHRLPESGDRGECASRRPRRSHNQTRGARK